LVAREAGRGAVTSARVRTTQPGLVDGEGPAEGGSGRVVAESTAATTREGVSSASRSTMARAMAAWVDCQEDARWVMSDSMACRRASGVGEAPRESRAASDRSLMPATSVQSSAILAVK
jgi:hypothetical protein